MFIQGHMECEEAVATVCLFIPTTFQSLWVGNFAGMLRHLKNSIHLLQGGQQISALVDGVARWSNRAEWDLQLSQVSM